MKKIYNKIFLAIISSFTLLSCNDAIDIVQDGELNEQTVFKTTEDLKLFLQGAVYTTLDHSTQVKITSLLTDELKVGPNNTGQDQGIFRFILTPDNSYSSTLWLNKYTTINRVNRLLEVAANITPSASEVAGYNNILAEARALRALAYLDLQTYFSTNLKDDNALGVILTDKVPNISDKLPRSTNAAIWSLMESDLAFASANLNSAYQASVSHTFPLFVSRAMVEAVRARMYLYRGMYTEAKTHAQNAITASGLQLTIGTPITLGPNIGTQAWISSFYVDNSINPYRRMWSDFAMGENIFVYARPINGTGGNIASIYTTNSTQLSGSPLWVMGLNLFNSLTTAPLANDIRRYAFIDPSSVSANGVYIIDKYPGRGNQPLRNNNKVIRLTEMFLILAECEAQNPSGLQTAASIIQAIRNARRYNGTAALPVYNTKVEALQDILRERRVELCFEGHRYIDLKRIGAEAGVSIDRNASDDFNPSTPLTLPVTDYRFTLPIPAAEILGNPKIIQNPGY